MKYLYEIESRNFEDYSSGRVLYNKIGATAFPVRLASEIFQRCKARLRESTRSYPLNIYDPCCGGGYILTTIGLLHGVDVAAVFASDIDHEMVALAQRNLSLLTRTGILNRIEQIRNDISMYNKDSHKQALGSAQRMKHIVERRSDLQAHCMQVDILEADPRKLIERASIDVVITDVPYGSIVEWSDKTGDPIYAMLSNLYPVLSKQAVIALVSNKGQKVAHGQYNKLEEFKCGKRKIVMLEPR